MPVQIDWQLGYKSTWDSVASLNSQIGALSAWRERRRKSGMGLSWRVEEDLANLIRLRDALVPIKHQLSEQATGEPDVPRSHPA